MASNDKKRFLPVLARGERYIQEEEPPGSSGGPKSYPRTFPVSQELLIPQLQQIQNEISELPGDHRVEEVIVAVDLLPDFLAKSYFPSDLLREADLTFIGSKQLKIPVTKERKKKRGKKNLTYEASRKLFVSGKDSSIDKMARILEVPKNRNIEQEFQKIDAFSVQATFDKIISIPDDFDGLAEVVLHGLPNYLRKTEVEKFLSLCRKLSLKCDPDRIRSYRKGPIFCPVIGRSKDLHHLAKYNPLRALRQMPNLQSLTDIRSTTIKAPLPQKVRMPPPLVIGMFDGGVDISNPALSDCVQEEALTPEKAIPKGVAHGTAVAGALVYGPLDSYTDELPLPKIGIQSFRVLPVPPSKYDGDLNYVIDQIELIVPQRNLDIYNLSMGPQKPIDDDEVDRFSYVLDQLSLRHNVVFFVAVGNDGDLDSPYNRIQPASDIVNGVGVGALTRKLNSDGTWKMVRADYSCVGPGRQGARRKPDISAFGGCQNHPYLVFSSNSYGRLNRTMGTSFACPTIAGIAGELRNSQTGMLNSLAVRTLINHTAKCIDDTVECVGVGEALNSADEILQCMQNRVTIVYQDTMEYNGYSRLPILIPKNLPENSKIKIDWTVIYLPKVNPNAPDEYTLEQIDVVFRPHDQRFVFNPPKGSEFKSKKLYTDSDRKMIKELLKEGYKQSKLPAAKTSKKPFMTEQDLRDIGKWNNSVVIGNGNTMCNGLKNPSLTLHVEHRYGASNIEYQDTIKYACVITIESKKNFNLYTAVRQQFRELTPLRIRERLRV